MAPVYLDHNATTPIDPKVLERMLPALTEDFGNAASVDHRHGAAASGLVDQARQQLAGAIGASPSEVIFTSGATESNNLAIIGAALANQARGRHVITTQIEHPSVLEAFDHLEALGFAVTRLPATGEGIVELASLESALRPDTILVSVMTANNEIGTIQPIAKIGALLRDRGIPLHTDAAQALAHVGLDVERDGISLMSLSAHKAYGPKGVGALYVRHRNGRVQLQPLLHGGGHERGLRSGTLNVPGIVGLGAAAQIAKAARAKEAARISKLRDALWRGIHDAVPDARLNGSMTQRLPGNLNVLLPGVENRALIQLVSPALSLSAGSACTTSEVRPSHVLLAIGRTELESHQSIRLSVGRFTTEEDVSAAVEAIATSVQRLRRVAPVLPRKGP